MFRTILIFGAIGGIVVGIPLSAIVILSNGHSQSYGTAIGYLIMLIGLTAVFVGMKRYRDVDLGGVIGFWQALGLGLGISVVAGILYVIAWEAACAIAHLDFASVYAKIMIDQERKNGVSGAALAKFIAQMDEFKRDYADPLYRWRMTFIEIFPVGVLVSLISAGLLRNRRFLPARRG